MDFPAYVPVLRRQIVLIVAMVAIGLSVGALSAMLTPQRYEAKAEVMVTVQVAQSATPSDRALATGYARQVVETYRTVLTSSLVLLPIINDLNLPTTPSALASRVRPSVAPNSAIITVSVSDENPGQAARVANAVTESFSTVIRENLEKPEEQTAHSVHIVTLQPAQVPTAPVAPNLQLSLVVGGLLGIGAGIGIALLRATLDRRVRTASDVVAAVPVPMLGQIPLDAEASDHPLAMSSAPHGPRAEAFRALRTNVQFLLSARKGVFVITSSGPGEGKSTTAGNLALAFADSGHRVALVDGDLRLPRVADYFEIEGGVGLSDVLVGRVAVNDVLQRWGRGALFLLPAGTVPPNPAELLGSRAMEELVDALRDAFDVVIIDAPPLLLVTDAAVVSRVATGAVLVAASGSTPANRLADAAKSIESVGARVLGTVLTKAPLRRDEKTSYGVSPSSVSR